jgi:hypothetical protein
VFAIDDDDDSRLSKAKRSSEIEHASGLELSPTVIAFVFATSFSAMECCNLKFGIVCTICARQRLHLDEEEYNNFLRDCNLCIC